MPVYEARCNQCGKIQDYIRRAENYLDTPECCGQKTEKVILSAPMGWVENIAYTSPIDGRPITTKQARIEDLRRNNARPWESLEQEQKEAKRRAAYEEAKQDAALEKVVTDAWQQLSPEKQAILSDAVV